MSGVEPIIDADLEIVDAHHHMWDRFETRVNFGGKMTEAYLLDDLVADTTAGHNVTSTVFVECGWHYVETDEVFASVGETAHVALLSMESETAGGAPIRAIVGHADLRQGSRAGDVLDALIEAGGGRFVGIRHATAWDADDRVGIHRTRPAEHLMTDRVWRSGFAEVAKRHLTFDAWVYHTQLLEVVSLADDFPETTIVVDHLGGPLAVGPYAQAKAEALGVWQSNLRELARRPNVRLKLGGIGMPLLGGAGVEQPSATLAALWRDRIRWCIELFGPERCMFESNFPVDAMSCSYVALWNAFKRMTSDACQTEKAHLFSGTARLTYNLRA